MCVIEAMKAAGILHKVYNSDWFTWRVAHVKCSAALNTSEEEEARRAHLDSLLLRERIVCGGTRASRGFRWYLQGEGISLRRGQLLFLHPPEGKPSAVINYEAFPLVFPKKMPLVLIKALHLACLKAIAGLVITLRECEREGDGAPGFG